MYRVKRKKGHRVIFIFLPLLLIVAGLGVIYYLLSHYQVKNVYVDGNVHYTGEEIQQLVMSGPLGKNSLYLSYRYKNKGITDIPFVDTVNVNILSPDTIRITVYEKALAGFVEYLGKYMYFDKEGTVVESSTIKTVGIPQITGLSFDYVVLGKALPVEDESVFKLILNISQLLTKYELIADRIYFDSSYRLTIYFGEVRACIGETANLDEKIMILPKLLPSVEGQKGALRMENYSDSSKNITFEPDT